MDPSNGPFKLSNCLVCVYVLAGHLRDDGETKSPKMCSYDNPAASLCDSAERIF